MLKIYTIKYISGKTLSECYDSQLAHNIIAAYKRHKECHPNSKYVKIRRHSDGFWLPFKESD